jgi:hypothetical protein
MLLGLVNVIIHLLIASALVGMAWYAVQIIRAAPNHAERNVRTASLLCGFLIYLGSRAVGLSLPDLLFKAWTSTGPISASGLLVVGLQTVFPTLAGAFVGYFFLRAFQDPDQQDFGFRVLIMLTALFISLFGDVYAASLGGPDVKSVSPLLLPNLCFLVGLMLYIMKYHGIQPAKKASRRPNWRDLI